jgi:hypothetical protein
MLCQHKAQAESIVATNRDSIVPFDRLLERNKDLGDFFLGQAMPGVLHHKAQTDLFG